MTAWWVKTSTPLLPSTYVRVSAWTRAPSPCSGMPSRTMGWRTEVGVTQELLNLSAP
jgi:hypothetical protein